MTLGSLSNVQLREVVRIAEIGLGSAWCLVGTHWISLQASPQGPLTCHGISLHPQPLHTSLPILDTSPPTLLPGLSW